MKKLLMFAIMMTCALPVQAQEPPAEEEAAEEDEEGPFADFEKLVEGAEVLEGFFDIYLKEDKLYLTVRQDQLGMDFLVDYRVAQGIGARGLYGGTTTTYFEMDLMAIEKKGDKLYLLKRPHRFSAESDWRVQNAVDITFGASVVESASVEATRPDSALVFDATGWFVGDMAGMGERMRNVASVQAGQPGSASFDGSRSYLEDVKSFENNTNIKAKLTFRSNRSIGLPSVPDGRFIPVTMHYTLAALPETPMERRRGDDRVGNFWTVHKDFSGDTDGDFFRRMVNRWRLEPGQRVGDKWRPVEPITYYIDRNVPDEYRAYFHAGVEAWNGAFEAAGWVDAIRAEDLPDGADPDDIRYATLRWNTSDETGYGAIGPSKVDPRTGEILDADILFEANMMLGRRALWHRVADPVTAAEAFESALGVGAFEVDPEMANQMGVELPGFASALVDQTDMAGALFLKQGLMAPGDPVPEEFVESAVVWVVMHEVGHSLGLQHNFRSSASTPMNRLHDEDWTAENGVFSSVMEYPTVNLNPEGDTGHYFNPGVGSYDRWAISYAYTQEQSDADEIARDVAEQGHMYGNESGGSGALDPSINTFDLGADPLAWGTARSTMILELLEELPDYVLDDDSEYVDATRAYGSLLNEYARALAPAVKYLGGAYMNRDHVGDGRLPFVNPGRDQQQLALDLLIDRLYTEGVLELPAETIQRFGTNGYSHFGSSRTFGGRYDFPFLQNQLQLQMAVMGQLMNPSRLQRMLTLEVRFGEGEMVTIPEMMDALTTAVWSELEGGQISANRRDLQRAYLDLMEGVLVDTSTSTPADARAVARWRLQKLGERIEGVAGNDAYTAAHLQESLARIHKAMEASLEAEGN
jgi:uncharacterized protein DUF4953/uncharacterized protein DUF5117